MINYMNYYFAICSNMKIFSYDIFREFYAENLQEIREKKSSIYVPDPREWQNRRWKNGQIFEFYILYIRLNDPFSIRSFQIFFFPRSDPDTNLEILLFFYNILLRLPTEQMIDGTHER